MSDHPPRTIDGGFIRCDFHTWDCSYHAALVGGFDQHHAWPVVMGGPERPDSLLTLCPLHHRRQHALLRAYVENGVDVKTVKWFSALERSTARSAVLQWISVGSPRVYWNTPAAAVYR